MKFLYEVWPSKEGPVFLPTLQISVINPKKKQHFPGYKVLLDSGASSCVFHAKIGEAIDINITKGEELPLFGVTNGGGKQYLHPVTIIYGGRSIDLVVGFSYDLKFPFGLLGEDGFLKKIEYVLTYLWEILKLTQRNANKI